MQQEKKKKFWYKQKLDEKCNVHKLLSLPFSPSLWILSNGETKFCFKYILLEEIVFILLSWKTFTVAIVRYNYAVQIHFNKKRLEEENLEYVFH